MLAWLSGRTSNGLLFDGTFRTLIEIYLTDPESSYRRLKPSSRHPYDVYAAKLKAMVGARRLDAVDGRDVRRWFAIWSEPSEPGGKPKFAAASMEVTVLKAALSFGIECRMAGCAPLKAIYSEIELRTRCPEPERSPTNSDTGLLHLRIRCNSSALCASGMLSANGYPSPIQGRRR